MKKVYNKLYYRSVEIFLVIVWSIWLYRNNVIFRDFGVQPAHVIDFAVHLFEDTRYYKAVSTTFGMDTSIGA